MMGYLAEQGVKFVFICYNIVGDGFVFHAAVLRRTIPAIMHRLPIWAFAVCVGLQCHAQDKGTEGQPAHQTNQIGPSTSIPQKPTHPEGQTKGGQLQPNESPCSPVINETGIVPIGKDRWDKAGTVAACVLALLGLVGLRFAYGTLKSTENAADAARLNAQAVIDSERGWVEVTIKSDVTLPPVIDPYSLVVLFVFPTVNNRGKTVCKLTKMYISKTFAVSILNLPSKPVYTENRGSSVLNQELLMFPNSPISPLDIGISMDEINRVRMTKEVLYVYGYALYEINGLPGETSKYTRFCFCYNIPGGYSPLPEGFLMPVGIPSYTETT
jgi:hypothetical protein